MLENLGVFFTVFLLFTFSPWNKCTGVHPGSSTHYSGEEKLETPAKAGGTVEERLKQKLKMETITRLS